MIQSLLIRAGVAAVTLASIALPVGAETHRLVLWAPPQHMLTASTVAPLVAVAESAGVEIEVDPGVEHRV